MSSHDQIAVTFLDSDPALENGCLYDRKDDWRILDRSFCSSKSDFLTLQSPDRSVITENLGAYPDALKNASSTLHFASRESAGNSQIRSSGELTISLQARKVEEFIDNSIRMAVDNSLPGADQFSLICSTSGGTGSSFVFMVAALIRKNYPDAEINLYVLATTEIRSERTLQNSYAFFMELNHYLAGKAFHHGAVFDAKYSFLDDQILGAPLFDRVYLASQQNNEGNSLSLDALIEAMADFIRMNNTPGMANIIRAQENNALPARMRNLTDVRGQRIHSTNFYTFGISSIENAVIESKRLQACLAIKTLLEAYCSDNSQMSDNIHDQVMKELHALRMSDSCLKGKINIFDEDLPGPSIDDFIAHLSQSVLVMRKKNSAAFIRQKAQDFISSEYQGKGIAHFYGTTNRNLTGAANRVIRILTHYTRNHSYAHYNLEYINRFLDELQLQLETMSVAYGQEMDGLPNRIKTVETNFNRSLEKVSYSENKILSRHYKFAVNQAVSIVSSLLQLTELSFALPYAINLVQRICSGIDKLRSDMTLYSSTLRDTLEKARSQENEIVELLDDNHSSQSGCRILLMDRDEAYKAINSGFMQAFAETAESSMQQKFPVMADITTDELFSFLSEQAGLLIHAMIKDTQAPIAQSILQMVPDLEKRQELVLKAIRKSQPFARFDNSELGKFSDKPECGGIQYDRNSFIQIAAYETQNHGESNHIDLRKEIASAGAGFIISENSDPNRIVFISEQTGYPFRVLSIMKIFRQAYQAHNRSKNHLPLHLRNTYVPPLADLFLASDSEINAEKKRKAAFYIALADQKIRESISPQTHKPEWRLYFDRDLGIDDWIPMEDTLYAVAERYMMGEKNSEWVPMISEQALLYATKKLSDLKTFEARSDMAERLREALAVINKHCTLGDEDPLYRRACTDIEMLCKENGLPL